MNLSSLSVYITAYRNRGRFIIMNLLCLFVFGLSSSAVLAVEKINYDVVCTQSYDCSFFEPTSSSTCDETASSLPQSASLKERKAFIYKTLISSFELKPFQAAGVMGNMAHESGFEPQRLQNTNPGTVTTAEAASGSSSGWGLVQWTPAGKIINTFSPKSTVDDIGVQLDFLKKQLEGKTKSPEKAAGDALKATKDISEATVAFETKYERHAGPPQPERIATAKAILVELGSSSGGDTTNPTTTSCAGDAVSSNGVIGDFSLPVPQKFYKSNRDWFTKPHHDYPSADIPVASGTKIFSATKGKVTAMGQSGDNGGQGTFVKITTDGVIFTYMHGTPGSIKVKDGANVEAGEQIMLSDNTGHSFGAHLHFQIEVENKKRCPQNFLDAVGQGKAPGDLKKLPASGCTN